METIDEPKPATRELTKTEIDIAVAQIADRLTRAVQFAIALDECEEDFDESDPACPVVRKYRDRFSIPEGVHPMVWERPTPDAVDGIRKHIRKWVRGLLPANECALIYLESVEMDEYDISWVFMEEPSFFYTDRVIDLKASCVRFCEIGSRKLRGKAAKISTSLKSLEQVPD